MDCGVEDLTHHLMYCSAGLPVSLISVVCTEDDEEGYSGHEDAYGVGVPEVFYVGVLVGGFVDVEEDVVEDYGEEGGEAGFYH